MKKKRNDKETPIAPIDDMKSLIEGLQEGMLTETQQIHLSKLLEDTENAEISAEEIPFVAEMRRVLFRGPIPHPSILNQYEKQAQAVILDMAQKEQAHAHKMQEAGLQGAIQKDRRGQWIGGGIAIIGLIVAAFIAQYSVVAATIIGALDLFGMVALFVAPRLLERRQSYQNNEQNHEQNEPD